jgi:hypothetical protein
MNDGVLAAIGVVSGIINLLGTVAYVRDIFRHQTKPERAMWWIYAVLFSVLFAAQVDAGARWVLLVTGGYVLSATFIAFLSLKYGYGKFHRRDVLSIVVAAFGLLIWWRYDEPLLAILMVIIVDFAGFWLTLIKTWHAPRTESLIAWQLSCIAAVLSVASVGELSFTVLVYPIYAALATLLIVWLIRYRRTKVAEDPADF